MTPVNINWCPLWTLIINSLFYRQRRGVLKNSLFCRQRRGGGGEEAGETLFCICSSSTVASHYPLLICSSSQKLVVHTILNTFVNRTPCSFSPWATQLRSLKALFSSVALCWLCAAFLQCVALCVLLSPLVWSRQGGSATRSVTPPWFLSRPRRNWSRPLPSQQRRETQLHFLQFMLSSNHYFQFIVFTLTNMIF